MQMAVTVIFNLIFIVLNCIVLGMTIEYDTNEKEIEKMRETFDKLDDVITKQIDESYNQVECQTLRWVLDTISEVTTDADSN